MMILGVHGGVTVNQHDAAAALLRDGELVCCVEEERLYRVKGATGLLPIESISACLKEAGIPLQSVDIVAIPGETYKDIIPRTEEWLMHHFGYAPKVVTVNHQTAHISSAFYHSGFNQAMCLAYDAYGDGISGALAVADSKNGIKIIETSPATNSLGVFYATMTSFLGFKPGEDEYKVMGLAPYGKPNVDLSFFCRATPDGYQSDPSYFRSRRSATQYEPFYSDKLIAKIGTPRRKDEPINDRHRDLAASTQAVLEESAVSLVRYLHRITGEHKLCIAGGIALNCSANRILNKLPFLDGFFVQPAASDRGLALGCALYIAALNGDTIHPINHVFYGPNIEGDAIKGALDLTGIKACKVSCPSEVAAQLLSEGKIVAWYQGRSEFGPRALGHRSILADPGLPHMKHEINARVKFREEFRPFAPSVLEERYAEIFDLKTPSPYMTIACDVKLGWGERLPATTHVNNTARVQTVNREVDPLYHLLIERCENYTGRPVVLNTSFNIKGQPMVESPLEAISTFAGNGIDALVMGHYLIKK